MLRILHVDRSDLYRKVIREIITRCGHSVDSVATIGEAKDAFIDCRYDLVLTALEFSDGTGETLVRELAKEETRDIPIIVITATDSIELRERLFALGVVDYLLKNEIDEARIKRYLDALAVQDELSHFMRNLKVAVLDDSKVILKIVSNILKMNNFRSVSFFENPLDLISCPDSFDLYLTDIVLPGMTGEQVVVRLRERRPDAIIVCMSQFATDKPVAGILLAGADDYIPKPFDASGLISRLKVNVRSYQLKKRLEEMAVTDGLTGLYNHRFAYDRLEEEVSKARRYGRKLSVLMLDLDDFKRINDTLGHRKGDEVLRQVAETIRGKLRRSDLGARYGGEEFLVILPESDRSAALVIAEKLRKSVEEIEIRRGSNLSLSLGLAELGPDEDAGSLVSRADKALYAAKKAGKNRVEG